jgi:hypothetical protein
MPLQTGFNAFYTAMNFVTGLDTRARDEERERVKEHRSYALQSAQLDNQAAEISTRHAVAMRQQQVQASATAHKQAMESQTINIGGKEIPIGIGAPTLDVLFKAAQFKSDMAAVENGKLMEATGQPQKYWQKAGYWTDGKNMYLVNPGTYDPTKGGTAKPAPQTIDRGKGAVTK